MRGNDFMKPPIKRVPFSGRAKAAALFRAEGKCEKCHSHTDRFEFDHWTPVAYDGPSIEENCRALCVPCHRQVTRVFVKSHAKVKRLSAKRRETILVVALRQLAIVGIGEGSLEDLKPQRMRDVARDALKRAGLE